MRLGRLQARLVVSGPVFARGLAAQESGALRAQIRRRRLGVERALSCGGLGRPPFGDRGRQLKPRGLQALQLPGRSFDLSREVAPLSDGSDHLVRHVRVCLERRVGQPGGGRDRDQASTGFGRLPCGAVRLRDEARLQDLGLGQAIAGLL